MKVLLAMVAAFVVSCSSGASAPEASEAPESRWVPIEAPRADLECWETLLSWGNREPGQRHIECWPKVAAQNNSAEGREGG